MKYVFRILGVIVVLGVLYFSLPKDLSYGIVAYVYFFLNLWLFKKLVDYFNKKLDPNSEVHHNCTLMDLFLSLLELVGIIFLSAFIIAIPNIILLWLYVSYIYH